MSYEIIVEYDPEHPDNRCAGAPSQVLEWVADADHLEQNARNAFTVQVFSDERRSPNAIQHIDRKAQALVHAVMAAGYRNFTVHHSY